MNRTASCALAGAGVFLLCAGALSCFETVPGPATPAPMDFVSEVKPILQERCVMCHNRATASEADEFREWSPGDERGRQRSGHSAGRSRG